MQEEKEYFHKNGIPTIEDIQALEQQVVEAKARHQQGMHVFAEDVEQWKTKQIRGVYLLEPDHPMYKY